MCREYQDFEIQADAEAEYVEAMKDAPKFEPTDKELEDMNRLREECECE